jgi:hypothetical protein
VGYQFTNADFGATAVRITGREASDQTAERYFYLHDRLGSDAWWAELAQLVKFWNAGTIAFR